MPSQQKFEYTLPHIASHTQVYHDQQRPMLSYRNRLHCVSFHDLSDILELLSATSRQSAPCSQRQPAHERLQSTSNLLSSQIVLLSKERR